jgi:8-oxo-dGTP pyrophosphatase MutT (NUDIX family)
VKTYVLGFCFNTSLDKVVLIKKRLPEWQAGRLNGVGGHVEHGETTLGAMVREFREETGWAEHVGWVCFGRLRCSAPKDDSEVYLFRGKYDTCPGPHHDGPEGLVSVHHVSSVLSGRSQDAEVIPNVRVHVPMALNHATGADRAEFFEIYERSAPPPARYF